jgi:hypothetical protein
MLISKDFLFFLLWGEFQQGGCRLKFWLHGHFHFPIIAHKCNVTIVAQACGMSMRDVEVRLDKRTTVFKPDGQQQWHELRLVHPRSSMRKLG